MTLAETLETAVRWPVVALCALVYVVAVAWVGRRHRRETMGDEGAAKGRMDREGVRPWWI